MFQGKVRFGYQLPDEENKALNGKVVDFRGHLVLDPKTMGFQYDKIKSSGEISGEI